MEYSELTIEQQKAILAGRKAQLEQEHFGHSMLAAEAEAVLAGLTDKAEKDQVREQVKQTERAIKDIDRRHKKVKERLDALVKAAPDSKV